MSTEPVIVIDTATLATPVAPSVHVRIGGKTFEVHCPKDAVLFDIYEAKHKDITVVRRFLTAMIGADEATEVEKMLSSPKPEDVTFVTLYKLVRYLMNDPKGPKWEDAVVGSIRGLGSGVTPTTQKVAAKKPVKRATAARKAARK
ncbi:hypothetical protein [Streptomyces sp. NPDC001282]|uniref:hypothetical protein n=1 Tax=Streptomyces sp. NPDC001282 TaxID=3364557 RepID=UPI0036AEAA8E